MSKPTPSRPRPRAADEEGRAEAEAAWEKRLNGVPSYGWQGGPLRAEQVQREVQRAWQDGWLTAKEADAERLSAAERVVAWARLAAAVEPDEHPQHFAHWRDNLRAELKSYEEAEKDADTL